MQVLILAVITLSICTVLTLSIATHCSWMQGMLSVLKILYLLVLINNKAFPKEIPNKNLKIKHRQVSCKDPWKQLFLIAVTSQLDAVVAMCKCIASNEKSVMVKMYGICLFREYWQFHTSLCLLEAPSMSELQWIVLQFCNLKLTLNDW